MKNNIVIIPAYNEEKYIGKVISEAKKIVKYVLIVDDCSMDNTVKIAESTGAIILRTTKNRGNSSALKLGIEYSINEGFENIITIDGDFAHTPKEIKTLLEFSQQSKIDLTIGNRFHEKSINISSSKEYANNFVKFIMNKFLDSDFSDVASGFRILSNKFAEKFISNNMSDGFMFVYEQIVFARKNNFKIGFCPISVNYDASDLLITQRVEFVSVLEGFKNFKDLKEEYIKLLYAIKKDVSSLKPLTMKFGGHIYCLHPILQADGYLFQKQANCFENHTIGILYNFDNV